MSDAEKKDEGHFKVVELATVTDETLEECLNHWTKQGFTLDAIHFAMRESSRRPTMAFVVFLRPEPSSPAS
ncbi:MAG: DUF4177 domain-containing protein [Myxococcota bacterium]